MEWKGVGILKSVENAEDMLADVSDNRMVTILISSRVDSVPLPSSSPSAVGMCMWTTMASPGLRVELNCVSWPMITVPEDIINPCPFCITGPSGTSFWGFARTPLWGLGLAMDGYGGTVEDCSVLVIDSPMVMRVASACFECLDFFFFFLVSFSPLNLSFPFPMLNVFF